VTRRVNDFHAGHLKSAVAGAHKRAQPSADLRSQRSGNGKLHGSVETLCQIKPSLPTLISSPPNSESPDSLTAIIFLRPERKMIDLTQDIGNADVTIEFRGRRTEVVAIGYFLPVCS
jgi:hypothetical protein